MGSYIKKVIINITIENQLKEMNFYDRLGKFAIIEMQIFPNQEYIARSVIGEISRIYETVGYPKLNYDELKSFSENGESWIEIKERQNVIMIFHKYWNLKKVIYFRQEMELLSKFYKFELELIELPRKPK